MDADYDKHIKISKGLVVKKEEILSNSIIPKEIIRSVKETPYYLLIFIIREEIIKINLFPIDTNNIKKILINLVEFSPELVNAISENLKQLQLKDHILFTTGICYSEEACYYESYLNLKNIENGEKILNEIENAFKNLPKVLKVIIEDIATI